MSEQLHPTSEAYENFNRDWLKFKEQPLTNLEDAERGLKTLFEIRNKHTGKKSEISSLMKRIGQVAPNDRIEFAQAIQELKTKVEIAIDLAEK